MNLNEYYCAFLRHWICHSAYGPPTTAPARPSSTNFVAINSPTGLSPVRIKLTTKNNIEKTLLIKELTVYYLL